MEIFHNKTNKRIDMYKYGHHYEAITTLIVSTTALVQVLLGFVQRVK